MSSVSLNVTRLLSTGAYNQTLPFNRTQVIPIVETIPITSRVSPSPSPSAADLAREMTTLSTSTVIVTATPSPTPSPAGQPGSFQQIAELLSDLAQGAREPAPASAVSAMASEAARAAGGRSRRSVGLEARDGSDEGAAPGNNEHHSPTETEYERGFRQGVVSNDSVVTWLSIALGVVGFVTCTHAVVAWMAMRVYRRRLAELQLATREKTGYMVA